jgi:hypothetical protein
MLKTKASYLANEKRKHMRCIFILSPEKLNLERTLDF